MMRFLLSLGIVLIFVSCSNELELYGENYTETAVVYGIIDYALDSQMVRVNKTFRNTSSASETLNVYDSLCFENVEVSLTFAPSNITEVLTPIQRPNTTSNRRDLFVIPTSRCDKDAKSLKLTVTNINTGKQFTCIKQLLTAPRFATPFVFSFSSQLNQFGFISSNASDYSATIRMYYTEDRGQGLEFKQFDYPITEYSLLGGLHFEVVGSDWLYAALQTLGSGQHYTRTLKSFSIFVSAESEDLLNYQKIQQPSIYIVPKNTFYSNINGGIGLFTTRGSSVQRNIPPDAGLKILLKQKLNMDS